jgi:hypothetical protein
VTVQEIGQCGDALEPSEPGVTPSCDAALEFCMLRRLQPPFGTLAVENIALLNVFPAD